MKAILAMLVAVALCSGCSRSGAGRPPGHTKFFETHEAGDYFRAVANADGLELGQVARSHAFEGTAAQKDFAIVIGGDEKTRDTLLHNYRDYLAAELESRGLVATGGNFNALGAPVSGFALNYRTPDWKGIIRVGSEIKYGSVMIDVFIYEHSLPDNKPE